MNRRLVVTLAVCLAACQDPTAFDAVTVEVTAAPLTVAAGDTVHITVAVRNPTDRTLTLSFDTDCQMLYRIVTSNGFPVAPANPWICTQGQTTMVLGPNTTGSVQYDWEASVLAGSYRLFGYLGANQAREAGPLTLTVQ